MKRKTRQLVKTFFKKLGPNAESFRAILNTAPTLCFNMKDMNGRIMALNRRNCEICNIKDERDALGLTSFDLFPTDYAKTYDDLDNEVRKTGRPVLNRITTFPADRSKNLMISNLYPIFSANGHLIGTAHAYTVTSESSIDEIHFRKMRFVSDYIAGHLSEDLSIKRLAELTNLSVSAFKRIFNNVFGASPGGYVLNARINQARTLLETSSTLLPDIAQECGFFDQSHFTRTFKKERGITPGEYRRQHRKC